MELQNNPHRRLNPLTGEWVLVSPHRAKRPWNGKVEALVSQKRNTYEPNCYLCPGNERAGGKQNPDYQNTYVFTNDFAALLPESSQEITTEHELLQAEQETGICKVICFSPRHDLTIPQMEVSAIRKIIDTWCTEFAMLSQLDEINYIQIFENKGEIMGCSNPHPHGQIWASKSIPVEIEKESIQQKAYYEANQNTLLSNYLALELQKDERVIAENAHFVALIPFWAFWPFETMIISKRSVQHLLQFSDEERTSLAAIYRQLTIIYDNLFQTAFPYSAGIHQAPVDGFEHPEWHWHMHFYPPLLRSATVKKFRVGYEMLATPQRDITPEKAAEMLKDLPKERF
ncbi:MAG: UDP-glucose--hexose-1-phosphate uridylyltransferase [Flammeovirgaceae bacterium]